MVKKIGMLNCLRANEVCTGAACMKAYQERAKSFAAYTGQETALMAFMRCNGCGREPAEDKGLQEKLDRLQSIGVEVMHVGVCTKNREGKECPTITKIISMLEERGIEVVRGTH